MIGPREMAMVREQARRLHRRLPSGFPLDELIAAGNLALVKAAARWHPGPVPFPAFAHSAVRGAMLDELRRADPLTRSERTLLRRWETTRRQLASERGSEPQRAEVAARAGVDPVLLDGLLQRQASAQELPAATAPQAIAPDRADTLAARNQTAALLAEAATHLSGTERRVLLLYYRDGVRQPEIARATGRSVSGIQLIRTRALGRLRQRFHSLDIAWRDLSIAA